MSLLWKFLGNIPSDAFELAYLSGLTSSLERGILKPMFKTRYSAISTFLKCRALYKFQYVDLLKPKRGKSLPRMSLGSAVHLGYEKYFKGATLSEARAAVEKSSYEILRKVREQVSVDPMSMPVDNVAEFIKEYEDIVENAPKIFERSALAMPVSDWEPVLVEHTLEQEISPGIVLTGTPDLIARYKPDGQLYLIDYKTRSNFQDITAEKFNLQFPIYTWMLGRVGYDVKGTYTYEIISEVPKEPKRTKDGVVSKSKCRTTEAMLTAAIEDSNSIPEDYTDLQAYVKGLEWQRMVYNHIDPDTLERIVSEVVIAAAKEMAAPHTPLRVTNRFSCSTCDFSSLCYAPLEGGDVAYLKAENFTLADGAAIPLFTEEEAT